MAVLRPGLLATGGADCLLHVTEACRLRLPRCCSVQSVWAPGGRRDVDDAKARCAVEPAGSRALRGFGASHALGLCMALHGFGALQAACWRAAVVGGSLPCRLLTRREQPGTRDHPWSADCPVRLLHGLLPLLAVLLTCCLLRCCRLASPRHPLGCRFAVAEGDLISYLNVWKAWEVRCSCSALSATPLLAGGCAGAVPVRLAQRLCTYGAAPPWAG